MKVDNRSISGFFELDSWVNSSTQKANFLKILNMYETLTDESPSTDAPRPDSFSEKLTDVAEGLIGKSYTEMNCYEMVVETLEKSGYDYYSKNGVAAYLAARAKESNLPVNSYMTGEGLVEATGEVFFSKTIPMAGEPEAQARGIMNEMESFIENGAVLSFSMQSAGHTGFVSGSKNRWTYINSGRLDNNIRNGNLQKGVGEEPMVSELENWLKRAKRNGEPLTITLGRFDKDKLAAFQKTNRHVSFTA